MKKSAIAGIVVVLLLMVGSSSFYIVNEDEVAVVSLYQDEISGTGVNWSRLVEDIFAYDRIICWW